MTQSFEFSRPYQLERLGAGSDQVSIEANADERKALAERLGLVGMAKLSAEISIKADPALDLLLIKGHLAAEVTQTCIVTLEPLGQVVNERFQQSYSLGPVTDDESEEEFDPEAPEALPETGLDLGEEVAQQLSLALDPYPRAPGAALPDSARDQRSSPFADLATLGKKASKSEDEES